MKKGIKRKYLLGMALLVISVITLMLTKRITAQDLRETLLFLEGILFAIVYAWYEKVDEGDAADTKKDEPSQNKLNDEKDKK